MGQKLNYWKPATLMLAALCCGLAFSASRDLYVSSSGTNSVKRYDGDTGAYIGDFVSAGLGGLTNPQGISFGPDGNLYVSSFVGPGNSSVLRYDGQTGAFLGQFNAGYNFNFAADLSWRNGVLHAADFTNNPATGGIHKFDSSGNWLGRFANTTVGSDGHLYGSDGFFYAVGSQQGNVKRFDATTGAFIGNVAGVGFLTLDLREGSDGALYVNSFGNGSIVRIDKTTGATSTFISGLVRTQGQEVAPDGSLLVGSYSGSYINKYDEATGALISNFISAGSGGLSSPNNFVYGPDPVPEPASMTIVGIGVLAILRRKRRNK